MRIIMNKEDVLISYTEINRKKDALWRLLENEASLAVINKFLIDNFRVVFDVNFLIGFKAYDNYKELFGGFDEEMKLELLRPLSRRQSQCAEALFSGFVDAREKIERFWDFLDDNERSGGKKYLSVAEIGVLSAIYERALMATS